MSRACTTVQVPNVGRVPLPRPTDCEGLSAPGVNFAGPGWRGKFRTRPTTLFDLAAKIHDLAYHLNRVSFGASIVDGALDAAGLPTNSETLRIKSRKAKADAIFRRMTTFSRTITSGFDVPARLYGSLANMMFHGADDSQFKRGDGFRNPLLESEVMAFLNDPTKSLTIPYDQLPRYQRTIRTEKRYSHLHGMPVSTVIYPDYSMATRMDRNPGFRAWFERIYAPILPSIRGIT